MPFDADGPQEIESSDVVEHHSRILSSTPHMSKNKSDESCSTPEPELSDIDMELNQHDLAHAFTKHQDHNNNRGDCKRKSTR